MSVKTDTQWLRAFRYLGDLMRSRGLCGRGWPVSLCGLPAGHDEPFQVPT